MLNSHKKTDDSEQLLIKKHIETILNHSERYNVFFDMKNFTLGK